MERTILKIQSEITICTTQLDKLRKVHPTCPPNAVECVDEGTVLVEIIQLKARKKAFQEILCHCEAELDFELGMSQKE